MRYFKLTGANQYNYYQDGQLKRIAGGTIVKALEFESAQFESSGLFTECTSEGDIRFVKATDPQAKITSRNVFKYNKDGQLVKQ